MLYQNSDKTFPIEDFSGGMRTTGTFFSRIQSSPKTLNGLSGKGKTLRKRPGFDWENIPGIGTDPITGLYEYGISDSSRKQIIHVGSNLYKMDELDRTWDFLQGSITSGATSEFETFTTSSGNVMLHCTHSNDTLKSLTATGTTMTEITGSGAPSPKYIKAWNNHVWAAGIVNNPSRLRFSNVATYTNWQTSGIDNYDDNFQTSDGDFITGLAVLRGNLYVFKRYSIFRVTYLGGTPLISVLQVISGTGCISNKSIAEAEVTIVDADGSSKKQVLIFLTADKKIVAFDGTTIYPMSDVISDDNFYSSISMNTLNDSALSEAHAIFVPEQDMYLLFVANSSSSTVDHCLALNTITRGIFAWDNMDFRSSAIFTYQNKKIPYVGGYTGQVFRFLYGAKDSSPTVTSGLVSLLHFDNADASTVITDNMNNVWTANSGAAIDIDQYKFGSSSLLLDGTDDYISTPYSPNFDFSGGIWTVDCWIRANSLDANGTIWSRNTDGNNYIVATLLTTGEIKFDIVTSGSTTVTMTTSSASITTGAWFHIEINQSGTAYKIFVNGTQRGSTTDSDLPVAYAGAFEIGRLGVGTANYFNGWIDEFRVLKGVRAHSTTFTPPTTKYDSRTFTDVDIDFSYEFDLLDSRRPDILKKARYVLVHLKPRSNTTFTISRAMQFQSAFGEDRDYVTDASSYPLGSDFSLGTGTLGGDFGSILVYDIPDSFNQLRLRFEESSTLESFEIHRVDLVQAVEGLANQYYSGVVVA